MDNEEMADQVRAMAALEPGIQFDQDGSTITVAIGGDWAVTGVSSMANRHWRTFSQEQADQELPPMVVARTIIQLQPRRGGL